jgi:hypothetical protein
MITKIGASLIVLLAAATAHAGAEQDKSEDLATAMSLAGSIAGPALIVESFYCCDGYQNPNANYEKPMLAAGVGLMVLGPSAGEWYAGKTITRGLKWRIGGGLLAAAGSAMVIGSIFESGNPPGVLIGGALALGGGGAFVVGTGLDFADAHVAVREYNESRHHATIVPTGRGVALVGTF